MKSPKSSPAKRRPLVDDLARKMEAAESGREPMQPLAYRVQARMLRRVLSNYSGAGYEHHDPAVWSVIEDAMANRCFDSTGHLPTVRSGEIKRMADALIARCRLSSR